jgi:hypothetical protein
VLSDSTRLLPHVGNATRNVVIRSENPAGTRGHTLFTHRADVLTDVVAGGLTIFRSTPA